MIEGKTADDVLKNAVPSGCFRLRFNVDPIGSAEPATATATAIAQRRRPQPDPHVRQRRFGWQLSRGSATALLSAFG